MCNEGQVASSPAAAAAAEAPPAAAAAAAPPVAGHQKRTVSGRASDLYRSRSCLSATQTVHDIKPG